ncbi:MAG: serine/threonine-protein kinase [Rubrivivax sp.]
MVDAERWKRLSALIDEAWALQGDARSAWLAELARTEPALANQVRDALADETTVTEDTKEQLVGRTAFGAWLAPALSQAPPPAATVPDLHGVRLGPWRLDEKIGEGGMGQVWRAHRDDGLFQGQAAIKLLRDELGHTALAVRFARERALLARLSHPGIARLLDAGIGDARAGPAAGQAFLVLELVTGQGLSAHVRRQGLPLAGRVQLLMRVAEAVEYAHARLVVHRDLKPANVLVGADGAPKLLDFGIAALLEDEGGSGGEVTRLAGRGLTPSYAAPEQITGAPIGTGADLFSLGVMLYELCSGSLPFGPRSGSRTALEHAVLHQQPRRLAQLLQDADTIDPQGPGRPADAALARGDLEAVAYKALRKDPADRYAGVRAFIDDLQAWLDHRPVSARRDNWRHNTRLWVRRHALLVLGTALVFVSMGAGLGVALWQRQRADLAAREAGEVAQYLVDMLASASPDRHGGRWPTVLQLLETSRNDLAQRFPDSPDTRLRVSQVLVETYRRLNRLDITIPMARELLAQTRQRYGDGDRRTLTVLHELVLSWNLQGQCDLAWQAMEPLLDGYRALRDKADRDTLTLPMLGQAAICASRTGRAAQADALLAEMRTLLGDAPPEDARVAIYHAIHTGVLSDRGQMREALEEIRRTQPFWASTDVAHQRDILLYQRNFLVMQIRNAEYERIEERGAQLLQRYDAFFGPGSNIALSLRHELARYQLEVGRYAPALRQREDDLEELRRLRIDRVDLVLPRRALALLAQAQAQAAAPDALRTSLRQILDETERARAELGLQRADIWLALARVALSIDDAELARQVLARLADDAELKLAPGPGQNQPLLRRKQSLDAGLARLAGDLAASRALLQARVQRRAGTAPAPQVPAWSAALDLAYTLVLMKDPGAAEVLAHAAELRPSSVPAGHPLDAATAYLRALQAEGREDAAPVRQAQRAMQRAQQGVAPGSEPVRFPGPLRGNLGGVLF